MYQLLINIGMYQVSRYISRICNSVGPNIYVDSINSITMANHTVIHISLLSKNESSLIKSPVCLHVCLCSP
jgi:hypothetical protein